MFTIYGTALIDGRCRVFPVAIEMGKPSKPDYSACIADYPNTRAGHGLALKKTEEMNIAVAAARRAQS